MSSEETIEEFLRRGGKITKCDTVKQESSFNSRYKQRNIDVHDHNNMTRLRVDSYRKKGKLSRDMLMYLKFRKRFGL
jgi:hypothetical protein